MCAMKKKRFLIFMLAAVMVFVLAMTGCGKQSEGAEQADESAEKRICISGKNFERVPRVIFVKS